MKDIHTTAFVNSHKYTFSKRIFWLNGMKTANWMEMKTADRPINAIPKFKRQILLLHTKDNKKDKWYSYNNVSLQCFPFQLYLHLHTYECEYVHSKLHMEFRVLPKFICQIENVGIESQHDYESFSISRFSVFWSDSGWLDSH